MRLTPHRRAILRVLRTARTPLSAEALHRKVPGAHLVTLYRTLLAFEQAGIVRTIGIDRKRATFELALDHHHHIICTCCDRVENVRVRDTRLEREALRFSRSFHTISAHALEFFGICKRCAKP